MISRPSCGLFENSGEVKLKILKAIIHYSWITEWLRLAGTSKSICFSPSSTRGTQTRVLRTVTSQATNTSKETDLKMSLVTLFNPSHNTKYKSASWCTDHTFGTLVCARSLLSCHWAPLTGAWPHPLCTFSSHIYTRW